MVNTSGGRVSAAGAKYHESPAVYSPIHSCFFTMTDFLTNGEIFLRMLQSRNFTVS
jgi:hypothetical protein